MSFLDSIKNMFSRVEMEPPKVPYSIQTSFTPYRLKARAADSVELTISVKNLTNETKLTSITVRCAGEIGFSETTLKKDEVIKVGMMKPGEEKKFFVKIYGSSVTKEGDYPIAVIVTSHFRDYDHIENAVRKKLLLRTV